MLENRKHNWMLLPLIAALGCAAAADEASEPVTSDSDTTEHAHDHHAQLPEAEQASAPLDAGASARQPAKHEAEHEAEAEQEAEHAGHADDEHDAHASDAAVAVDSERADAAKPASKPTTDAQVAPPRSGEVEGATPTFDAGAGQLQPDGKTVVYRIPNGTGNKDWNSRDNPVKVKRGMTLKLIDDDKTAKGGGHWLHSFGICPHSSRAIGAGYECKIPQSAKTGLQSGLFEHNIANAGGRIYLVVVD